MTVGVVTCVTQIVFEGKNLWQEIVKRFHVIHCYYGETIEH